MGFELGKGYKCSTDPEFEEKFQISESGLYEIIQYMKVTFYNYHI